MPLQVDRAVDLAAFVGQDLPASESFALSQSDVDRFVALSGDRQWIHSDVARAKAVLPAGRTIVPGNLLIAQLPRLLQQAYSVARCEMCMVAEYRRVRFRHPVGTEVPLLLQARFLSVTPTRAFVRVETACELNFAESGKPALTATLVDLFYASG
ncbi:MAG TPA: MaoC/PaaZ C-terminal domain-containing protein [Rhodopseudomonas sp.]|uniref:MaoC/PaaZ C-terminal domain-containing protein n=1 Tax=Rhodopseudomonas sp. TaxID=1078 RepID=UPI002ED7B60A